MPEPCYSFARALAFLADPTDTAADAMTSQHF